jgi:phage-related baseplate assembly protein
MTAMPDFSASSTAIDLSRLPAPAVVQILTFEQIFDGMAADMVARQPGFDPTIQSDPAVKVLQVSAYREMLLRQDFNDRARGLMLAYATGTDLDHLAANFLVVRLVLDAGDPDNGIAPTLESDDELRARVVLAPEAFSVAGPELAYISKARAASADVRDASVSSPAPGEVVITILSRNGNGAAPLELRQAVSRVVGDRAVRPLGSFVQVQSAEIVEYQVTAALTLFEGPDSDLILEAARASVAAYVARAWRLSRDITLVALSAALCVEGVQDVMLTSPAANLPIGSTQAPFCTAINVTFAGYAS